MRIWNKHIHLWSLQQSRAPEKSPLISCAPWPCDRDLGSPGARWPLPAQPHSLAHTCLAQIFAGAGRIPLGASLGWGGCVRRGQFCWGSQGAGGSPGCPELCQGSAWILSHQQLLCAAVCPGQRFWSQFRRAHSPGVSHWWGLPRAGTSFLSPSLLVALGFGFSFLLLAPSPAGLALGFLFPLQRLWEAVRSSQAAVRPPPAQGGVWSGLGEGREVPVSQEKGRAGRRVGTAPPEGSCCWGRVGSKLWLSHLAATAVEGGWPQQQRRLPHTPALTRALSSCLCS